MHLHSFCSISIYQQRVVRTLRNVETLKRIAAAPSAEGYNFSSIERPTGRKNRTIDKKYNRGIVDVVEQLASLNDRQLRNLERNLPPGLPPILRIASKLPVNNQGRKRQINFGAKILRDEVDEEGLEQLRGLILVANGQSWQPSAFANARSVVEQLEVGKALNELKDDLEDEEEEVEAARPSMISGQ